MGVRRGSQLVLHGITKANQTTNQAPLPLRNQHVPTVCEATSLGINIGEDTQLAQTMTKETRQSHKRPDNHTRGQTITGG